MNNLIKILLIFIFLTSCSFQKNSKFWTISNIPKEESLIVEIKEIEEIFVKEEALSLEFNPNLNISLYTKPINENFLNNYDNNNGRINYDGKLKTISKFKFKKIDNFYQYDPVISVENNNIIFFDNKGAILKFDQKSELIWKKNYYSKLEKKQKPILLFANDNNTLIIADNIAKYYALDINTGDLLWSKNNSAPFNSQIKIYNNKFFVVDFDNILRAYSVKDGEELWNVKTEKTLIRSQKKMSMVIIDQKIYFNNSVGDISAVDINDGQLLWQRPTQNSLIIDQAFSLKTSDIIADRKSLYLSNNKNEFFSIDIDTGDLNWKQKINSNLRSTLIDNYIFSVSLEGYLIIIEKKSGNIVRSTNIFSFKKNKKNRRNLLTGKIITGKDSINAKPVGFIVGSSDIYVTTSNGKLLTVDIKTGRTKSVLKIDNDKISRPLVLNKSMYIIKDNSIIKLN